MALYNQDTGREAYHYQTIPEAYKNIPGFTDVANDPNQDPNAFAQNYLSKQRSQGLTDGGDAAALSGQGFLGGAPPSAAPKNSTPAQQWNALPAPQAAGPSVLPGVQSSAASSGQDALFQQLMARARQGTSVDSNDPNIRQQVDPYVAQQTRAARNVIADSAEAGGPYGNNRGEARMATERAGQNAGLFESEIIGREIAAKREEVSQALQLAGQMGNASAARELQQQLALLDDQARNADRSQNYSLAQQGYGIQRLGMDQQYGLQQQTMNQNMEQFMRELALREWQATDNSDQSWAQLGG